MDLVVGVNSYMTLEEVKQILNDYIYIDVYKNWIDTKDDNYLCSLINITTELIEQFDYKGKKVDENQELQFPRLERDENRKWVIVECPKDLKIGIVLQAVSCGYFDNLEELQIQKLGINSYKVDNASIGFGGNSSQKSLKLENGIYRDIYKRYIRKYTVYI